MLPKRLVMLLSMLIQRSPVQVRLQVDRTTDWLTGYGKLVTASKRMWKLTLTLTKK